MDVLGVRKQREGYTRRKHTFSQNRTVKYYKGKGALSKRSEQVLTTHYLAEKNKTIESLVPLWTTHRNKNGGTVYAPDTALYGLEVGKLLAKITDKNDITPITILTGVHGHELGMNWRFNRRLHSASWIFENQKREMANLETFSGRNAKDINIIDIGGKSSQYVRELWNERAHVIYATCYGAADLKLMKEFGIQRVNLFDS